MKTIKIFIASSEELKEERVLMASLANELSTRLEKVGIQVIAVEWESLDASMDEEHKQEEYNEKLRECDMCMVLYWTRFGMYTKTELDTAYHQKIAGENPQKVWVYFKETDNTSKEPSEELKEFRNSFPIKYGHFYTPFANFDTLKAHFLLQFMEYQSQALQGKSLVEVKDGKVTVDGKEYVDLQNVPFAGNNEEYNNLREEIEELKEDLEEMSPDSPRYAKKADKLQKSKEKLAKMESSLWDTALMITKLSTTKCSERLQRAMNLFNQGDNKGAQAILNEEEIEKDVQHNLNLIKLGEEGKKGLKTNIDEYLLKIRTIENEMEKGWLQKRCELCDRVLQLSILLYGEDTKETAIAYNKCGNAYYLFSNYSQAIEYHKKTLEIRKNVFGVKHPKSARSYNNIGHDYYRMGDYPQALQYYQKALEILKEVLGVEHPNTAGSYVNIGVIYYKMGDYPLALKYQKKALVIKEKVWGVEHPDTANSYGNIGNIYLLQGNNYQALEYYQKALEICEKVLGIEHPYTANSYGNVGLAYSCIGDYTHALEYQQKALVIKEKVWGVEHPYTANSYGNVGLAYSCIGDYTHALEYHQKALEIRERLLGFAHPDTAKSYENMGSVYSDMGDYTHGLEYYQKALKIEEKILGNNHPLTAASYNALAWAYLMIDKNEDALPWAIKAVAVCPDSPAYADTLATVYQKLGRNKESMEQFESCLKLQKERNGSKDMIQETEAKIATLKELMNYE